MLAILLGEALANFDLDRQTARRRIEDAFSLVQNKDVSPANRMLLSASQTRRVQQFIEAHLDTVLSMEKVASQVNLSASHFSRAFKAAKGIAYKEYVFRARIARAKHLLLTTDVPISEVALACGFCDQAHLTRAFGRATGVPPKAWRRQMTKRPARLSQSVELPGPLV
ncbi:helix-turn-helix transcriptional regulator [Bradyrhizobium sp. 83002]|uniref:helix-turn-helix domain-containing protein n=1 Tax=Bradyrhizobium aeschynomenes TaxID=2734909 RepID=UPI001556E524|nr:AraC family transcriptional regulator [Bradyrhizobium aeschynomenes]NPU09685.1 helix-turn-helix transcriptional regulator [Bradyrhizobium aeschynomenes]